MSFEAWGDEGDVPDGPKDTAMYMALGQIVDLYDDWQKVYGDYFPNQKIAKMVESVREKLDELHDAIGEDA